MSNNNKMKGLLKGLRYISHIFENEKEPDMQIGYPTDVKHVAHIGWDGPSVNSPSWMNEFAGTKPGYQSAPLNGGGDKKDDSVKWVSEDSSSRRVGRDALELPKSSRRHGSTGESPIRERSERSKHSKRSSKNSNKDLSESTKSNDASQGGEPPPKSSEMPKKSRRKKSRESADGSSRSSIRSSRRTRGSKSDSVSESGSVSGSISKARNDELCQNSEGGEVRGFTGIS